MNLVVAKCPNCGGELSSPIGRRQSYCQYCGHLVLAEESNATSVPKFDDFLELAKRSGRAGNHEEAYEYFKKALELNPESFEALIGKAVAAENLQYSSGGPPPLLYSVLESIEQEESQYKLSKKREIARLILEFRSGTEVLERAHALSPEDVDIVAKLFQKWSETTVFEASYYPFSTNKDIEDKRLIANRWYDKLYEIDPVRAADMQSKFDLDLRRALADRAVRERADSQSDATTWPIAFLAVLLVIIGALICCRGAG